MRISFNANPQTIDPRKNSDLVSSTLIFMLFEGLTKTLPNGEIMPALAERYEISEDQKTYIFHLRRAKWSDGMPITAKDFEYSWKSQLDPKFPCPCKYLLYPIKNAEKVAKGDLFLDGLGVRAVDDRTLVVQLESPAPYFLSVTSFCNLSAIPKHIAEKNPLWETDDAKLVNSGPFKLKKWNKSKDITLNRNPLYWDHGNVKLDELHVSIITDENTALQMFENNELDWIGTPISPIPQEALAKLQKDHHLNFHSIAGTMFLSFNLNHSPFKSLALRKAFTYAINRDDIVKNISRQDEIIATRYLPPALMDGKNRTLIEDNKAILAKTYLDEALQELNMTAKDMQKIRLLYRAPVQKNLAQALQKQWEKALGITIQIEACDFKVLLDKLDKHTYDISICSWIAQVNDPMNILDRFKFSYSPKNYPGWEDPEYIQLLDLTSLAKSKKERFAIIEKAEERFMSQLPIAPIYHFNYATMAKSNVRDIRICPIGSIQFYRADITPENGH